MMTLNFFYIGGLPGTTISSLNLSWRQCSKGTCSLISMLMYLLFWLASIQPDDSETRQEALLVVLSWNLTTSLKVLLLVILMLEADWNSFLQKTMTFSGSTLTNSSAYQFIYSNLLLLDSKQPGNGPFILSPVNNILTDHNHLSTMNTFGISVFREPEEMVALHLGMRTHTAQFLTYAEKLLQRTKSPPIAITYTYHFLKDKTEEELSLDVIRFISQLADISQGVSMSSSLNGILSESSFLTELRHSLTHKTMVKGTILLLSRDMIIDQLDHKFWRATIQKLVDTYSLSADKVRRYYQSIFQTDCTLDLSWLCVSRSLEYFNTCSNYEYKQHIGEIIFRYKQARLQADDFLTFYERVSEQKQAIFIVLLFQSYLESAEVSQLFASFLTRFTMNINASHFEQELVLRQCKKAFFLKYLPHAKALFELLPASVQRKVEAYWSDKERQVGRIYGSS